MELLFLQVERLEFKDLGFRERCEPSSLTIEPYTQQLIIVCAKVNDVFVLKIKTDHKFDFLGKVLDGVKSKYKISSIAVSPMAK